MLAKAFQQTHVWPTSYSCLEFSRTARTGNWDEHGKCRKPSFRESAVAEISFREPRLSETELPRIRVVGSLVSDNAPHRKPSCREELFWAIRRIVANRIYH